MPDTRRCDWLKFEETEDALKFKLGQSITVKSREHGGVLGYIMYHPAWRMYVLQSRPATVWTAGCLREAADYLEGLRDEQIVGAPPVRADG